MDVLVTGGSGFIGRAVVRELAHAGHTVTVLARKPRPGSFTGDVIVVQGDLRSVTNVASVVAGGQFDGVCHLASLSNARGSVKQPMEYFDTNIGGTVHLLKALRDGRRRSGRSPSVVFASTAAVYAASCTPISESHTTEPETPYAVSKLTVERLLSFEAPLGTLGATSLRCFNVAGGALGITDQVTERVVPRLVGAASGALSPAALLTPFSVVDLVHIVDVARAFVIALEWTQPGSRRIFNVGSGCGTRISDVANLVEEASSRAVLVDPLAESGSDQVNVRVADISAIGRELGWRPLKSVAEIVNDAWFFASKEPRGERES